jgi:FAD/FMN-containing dehydrogenase
MTQPPWLEELSSRLGGVSATTFEYRDFGGRRATPATVRIDTTSREEVACVFEIATRHAVPVAIRGSGHSSGGQTWAPLGILLCHRPSDAQLELHGDVAVVPAGWTWSQVEGALRAQSRDLMVATSSLETTVGGTLSVGGFGVQSIRRGAQVDHVTGLSLLCADGRHRFCSATTEPDLFAAALTGAGQVGIIERAWMSTAERRAFLACCSARHESFSELASGIGWMEDLTQDAPDYFSALLKQGVLESNAATAHRSEAAARAALGRCWQRGAASLRHHALSSLEFEAEERAMPTEHWWTCANLWCDYCFDAAGFASFCSFIDEELRDTLVGHLAYVMCVAPRQRQPTLALDMRPRDDRRCFSLGLFYSVPREDERAVARVQQYQARALEVCVELGGRPYLHGCWGGRDGLSGKQARALYGSGYERIARARARVDARGILNPNGVADGVTHPAPGTDSAATPGHASLPEAPGF